MDSLQELIDFNNRTRQLLDQQADAVQDQTDASNQALLSQGQDRSTRTQQQAQGQPGLNALSNMNASGATAGGAAVTAAPNVSLAGSGSALGSLEGLTATSGGAVSGGGGAAAGGSAAGGSAAGAGMAALWPYAIVAAAVGNELYARNHGERRSGGDYYKDLVTGRVLSQDVDKRWSPKVFGKNDNTGMGHDASFAADIGSFQFGKAFKDLKKSSLLTGFGLFK